MVDGFLSNGLEGASLGPGATNGMAEAVQIRLPREAQRQDLRTRLLRTGRTDRSSAELRRLLDRDRTVTVTFDQEVAVERRDIPFITPVHALARVAVGYWQDREDPLVAQLRVTTDTVGQGRYLFAFERWEELAARPTLQLVGVAVTLDDGTPAANVSDQLFDLIRVAANVPTSAPVPVPDRSRDALDRYAFERRRLAIQELQYSNASTVDQRLASLDAYYRGLTNSLDRVLETSNDPRILKMKHSERERREAEHADLKSKIESRRDADIVSDRIAVGVLEVANAK